MIKRFFFYIVFTILLIILNLTLYSAAKLLPHVQPIVVSPPSGYTAKVLLLPLDSRPPCTQFVQQLARLQNIDVILPPDELLDHYDQPANKEALRTWLYEHSKDADAAIVSTDMLIHGGLLASRQSRGTKDDIHAVFKLIRTIHKESPHVKLYVFSIIPRLLIADSENNPALQKLMLQYSVLKDQLNTFENYLDLKKLVELEQQLPPTAIARYTALYEQNTEVNTALIDLVKQGVITSLVLGQDDGQPFGLPNISKQRLSHYIEGDAALSSRVIITRGTDEVALTLLGHMAATTEAYHPRVYVAYSSPEVSQIVMPFMPHSISKTVEEKILLANGVQVSSPDDADFILYVHAGTQKTSQSMLQSAAAAVASYLSRGYKVALVDLTEDYYASETLLPILIKNDVNINSFVAYAGWNTTSNSIGTAVTQAAMFTEHLNKLHSPQDIIRLYANNLTFLTARFLDDWYYQKIVQPEINHQLRAANINPYQLGSNYDQTNRTIEHMIKDQASELLHQGLLARPLAIIINGQQHKLVITNLTLIAKLPWERTFEIMVKPTLSLAEVN